MCQTVHEEYTLSYRDNRFAVLNVSVFRVELAASLTSGEQIFKLLNLLREVEGEKQVAEGEDKAVSVNKISVLCLIHC